MPVLAIGGEKSFGSRVSPARSASANNVRGLSHRQFRPLADGRAARRGNRCDPFLFFAEKAMTEISELPTYAARSDQMFLRFNDDVLNPAVTVWPDPQLSGR